ncbi:type VI secretion system baseplate subunit TssK, partial [Klebsiella pneumoniae]|nr:type VI secretion system baseplate subunit TssK [Klebsiella pneumoniae]
MKIDRPLWASGVVLSAQQFQQQARFESWTNQSIASLGLVHPWGIRNVAF